ARLGVPAAAVPAATSAGTADGLRGEVGVARAPPVAACIVVDRAGQDRQRPVGVGPAAAVTARAAVRVVRVIAEAGPPAVAGPVVVDGAADHAYRGVAEDAAARTPARVLQDGGGGARAGHAD